MWHRAIAIGVVGVVGVVMLACSNAAADENSNREPTATEPSKVFDLPAGSDASQAGGSLTSTVPSALAEIDGPKPSLDPAVSGPTLLPPDRPVASPAGYADPALSTDPAVSGLSLLDPSHPAYLGPAGAPAYADDSPLLLGPPVRDLPQTDPYDPAHPRPVNPSQPNSTPPSPPKVVDGGGASGNPGTPPDAPWPIDRGTGKPLDPDGSVSSPPQPFPGINVPAPVPSGPTQPGLTPLPSGVDRVLAPIDDADIVVRESFPPQYAVEISAGLPGGCAKQAGYEVERSGNTFKVSVYNAMPSQAMVCTAIYGMYRVGITLTDITPGATYTVVVNDKTLTFTAQ